MKKFLLICTILFIMVISLDVIKYRVTMEKKNLDLEQEIDVIFKTEGKQFLMKKEEVWEPFEVRGMNLGAGKPGSFPNDFRITKEEYLRWFGYISELNLNTLRVYTILGIDFYEALYEFNKDNPKPLYLLQGVWLDEELMQGSQTAHHPDIKKTFIKDIKIAIDVVHGMRKIEPNTSYADGHYSKDISEYVLGYILGVEWEGNFVSYTNLIEEDKSEYRGDYLETGELARPFESFLAEVGDEAIAYESSKYNEQRLISYANWPTTDPLEHANEPDKYNKIASVDVEQIIPKENFKSGIFATYHAYPYYPDFLNFNEEYLAYIDEGNNINSYRAYLTKLNEFHRVPVFIGEYGVPSSRGMARVNRYRGFNQGFLNEKQQGEIVVKLYEDIKKAGCAGGAIFIWQDEWFKKTWNTMDYIDLKTTARWSDWQTNEQYFGLLAFDPGEDVSVSYIDESRAEWGEQDVISRSEDLSLSMKSDEKFLYFMLEGKRVKDSSSPIYIALDITPKSGTMKSSQLGLEFERATDFVIEIDGKENSRIYTHQYYNTFRYLYGKHASQLSSSELKVERDIDRFEPIQMFLRHKAKLDKDEEIIPPSFYETGYLRHGNGNPSSRSYDSLSDFYIGEDYIELRIPWQLINFMDPSSKRIQDDYYETKRVKPLKIKQIYAGAYTAGKTSNWGSYTWDDWKIPKYHERLKQSYYIIQEAFLKEN